MALHFAKIALLGSNGTSLLERCDRSIRDAIKVCAVFCNENPFLMVTAR